MVTHYKGVDNVRRGNGEGSIYKLGGKRRKPWAVRITTGWTLEGKQQYKYLGYYPTKTEAKNALREYLLKPYDLTNNNVTLKEVFERWNATTSLSEKTVKNYTTYFNKAFTLHKMSMRDIKAVHLETVMQELTPHAQRVFKNCMGQLYTYALKHEIVDKNIIDLITVKDVQIEEREPFTPEEIKSLDGFKHPLHDTFSILLYTGLRITELLEVETKNVHLAERYFIAGKKTKAGTDRVIPIHDKIYDLIEKRYNQGNKYLITRENRKIPYRSYRQMYWDKMKINHTPHDTRHTFATFADRCGMNTVAVKRIMGHTLKDVTQHYTHKNINELLEEINKLKFE